MKKLFALLLLVALIALPACGGSKTEETTTTQPTAYDTLTGLDKEFFDVFQCRIPQFNDPASVRVTKILYIDTADYGDYFYVTVNATNGFGGVVPTDYFLSTNFFGTTGDLAKLSTEQTTAITHRMVEKRNAMESFNITAINVAVKEYLEENGLS